MDIIARKPRPSIKDGEYVIVNRGTGHVMPYVVATIEPNSLKFNEWYWGHYFPTYESALEFFNGRS